MPDKPQNLNEAEYDFSHFLEKNHKLEYGTTVKAVNHRIEEWGNKWYDPKYPIKKPGLVAGIAITIVLIASFFISYLIVNKPFEKRIPRADLTLPNFTPESPKGKSKINTGGF